MKKWRSSIVYLLMLFVMLVPYLLNGVGYFSQKVSAETTEKQTIVENEKLKVEVEGQVDQENQHWKIYYDKKAEGSERQSRLKFRINEAQELVGEDFSLMEEWYTEEDFTPSSEGVIEVTVPKESKPVELEIQLDVQDETGKIYQNQFEDAGPYRLELKQPTEFANSSGSSQATESNNEELKDSLEKRQSTTSDSLEEPAEVDSIIEEGSAPVEGFSLYSGSLASNNFFGEEVMDPFQYYDANNSTGIFPKHSTNEYLGNKTSANVQNYNYGSTDKEIEDNIQLFNISGSEALDFTTGYHEYGTESRGRLNTKKTVSPTDDPNIFQVQLDTIGDAIRPIPKVDIVLVLDKSSSMNYSVGATGTPTRWNQLKDAVIKFSNDMLGNQATHDVQIGMAAFGSSGDPYGEIASFSRLGSGMPTSMTGFTRSAQALQTHAMFNVNKAPDSSGTPTFLGLDAGLKLLTTPAYGVRSDSKKVIITITDGQPTFSHERGYFSGTTSLDTSLNRLTLSNLSNHYVLRMTAGNTNLYGGNGTADCSTTNLAFINDRYKQFLGLNRYAVGYHTADNANEVVSKLGPEGAFKATDVDSLTQALTTAISELIATIYNGTIFDPISDFVTLLKDTVKNSALSLSLENNTLTEIKANEAAYPSYAKDIKPTVTENQIALENVNMGLDQTNSRQGYRLTYQVELKDEYRNGKFYPVNNATYLKNGNGNNRYYAVPSVKVPLSSVNFELKKVVNGTSLGLAGAKFSLFDQETGGAAQSNEVTSSAQGIVAFTEVMPGTYWLRETHVPEGFQPMAPIQITVDRQGNVTGEGIQNGEITNTLKQIQLTVNKKGQTNQFLAKAEFELRKGETTYKLTEDAQKSGVHTINDLEIGTYEVYEEKAPDGYQKLGKLGTLTITEKGEITFSEEQGMQDIEFNVDKTGEQITITFDVKNILRPFELNLTKRSAYDDQLFLADAVFTLYDKDPSDQTANVLATLTTNDSGKGSFIKTDGTLYELLAGKEYYFRETTAPEGYILSNSLYRSVIGTDGSAKIFENGTEITDATISLKTDANNQIGLTVNNEPKVPLPKTGGTGRLPLIIAGLFIALITTIYFWRSRDLKGVL